MVRVMLVAMGVVVTLSAVIRHFQLVRELRSGTWEPGRVSTDAVILGLVLHHLGSRWPSISRLPAEFPMKAAGFRRLALLLDGAEEGSTWGQSIFVSGAEYSLPSLGETGYGNLMLSLSSRRPLSRSSRTCSCQSPEGGAAWERRTSG